jgi:hypothetical protein
MGSKNDRLNRLVITSPCTESWEAMTGDGAARHCAQCDKDVYDLALLAPSEIARLIAKRQGRLCTRITRGAGGRIVTRLPPAVPTVEPARRASPLAATLVAGLLGVPAGASTTPPAERPVAEAPVSEPRSEPVPEERAEPPGVSLFGRLTTSEGDPLPGATLTARNTLDGNVLWSQTGADGRFLFVSMVSGVYEIEGRLDGWEIEHQGDLLLSSGERREVNLSATSEELTITAGITISGEPEALRAVFAQSPLVVVATTGASTVIEADGDESELETELFVVAVLKGEVPDERLILERWGSDDPAVDPLAPGAEVLAFLEPTGEGQKWESTEFLFGLEALPPDAIAAYRERLEALAELEPGSSTYPGELLEWLVATTEDPFTRTGAVGEISQALWALGHLADSRGTSREHTADDVLGVADRFLREGGVLSDEPQAELLGALLSDRHRARLTRALETTEGLSSADLDLFHLVESWAPEKAVAWLAKRFRAVGMEDSYEARTVVEILGEALPNPALQALAAEVAEVDYDDEDGLTEALLRFRRALGRL